VNNRENEHIKNHMTRRSFVKLSALAGGTAMLVGCDAASGSGYLLTALAFGLTIVGMAYCVGNISGCHINPAVSLAVYMTGGMSKKDFQSYVDAWERIDRIYSDKENWGVMSLMNIARSAYFSSDRTIREYADEIWHAEHK